MSSPDMNSDWLELFIREMERSPYLFRKSHPNYKNGKMKHNRWLEIGGLFDMKIGECKKKWKNLKDKYVKIKRGVALSKKTKDVVHWRWFPLMHSFLGDDEEAAVATIEATSSSVAEMDHSYEATPNSGFPGLCAINVCVNTDGVDSEQTNTIYVQEVQFVDGVATEANFTDDTIEVHMEEPSEQTAAIETIDEDSNALKEQEDLILEEQQSEQDAGQESKSDDDTKLSIEAVSNLMNEEGVKILLKSEIGMRRRPKSSMSDAWKYFGYLCQNNKLLDDKHVYCVQCFSNSKIARYKQTVSTGNLIGHLNAVVHQGSVGDGTNQSEGVGPPPVKKERTMERLFGLKPLPKVDKAKDSKSRLVNELAMFLARDLLPFSMVRNDGFKDFCKKFDILHDGQKMPDECTLQRSALGDIHAWMMAKVKKAIRAQSKCTLGLTLDCWTDLYRRWSYVTFTAHWIDPQYFEKVEANLCTSSFPHPPSDQEIAAKLKQIFNEFRFGNVDDSPSDKVTVVAVTDNSASLVCGCSLVAISHIPCLAHDINTLIVVDLFENAAKNYPDVPELQVLNPILKKMIDAHHAIVYLYSELKDEFDREKNKAVWKVMNTHALIDEIFESEHRIYFGSDPEKGVSLRWRSILSLMQSFVENNEIINNILEKGEGAEHALTQTEVDVSQLIVDVLRIFETSTESLCKTSTYPTLNLTVLLKLEISDLLTKKKEEGQFQKALCDVLLENMSKHFPLSEYHICAALLTPPMHTLPIIQAWLDTVQLSKTDFLKHMLMKLSIDSGRPLDVTEDGSSIVKEPPLKKAKETPARSVMSDILKKHCRSEMSNVSSEIAKFLLLTDVCEDPNPTEWWHTNRTSLPELAKLAQVIFSIPATSVPCESVFYTGGLGAATRRATALSPIQLKQILFVHDNYKLVTM